MPATPGASPRVSVPRSIRQASAGAAPGIQRRSATALPGSVTVSGNTARAEDTLGLSTQRFYRVVIEP